MSKKCVAKRTYKALGRVLISLVILITSVGFLPNNEYSKNHGQDIEGVSLVQNASISVSSPLIEGGKVYFTIKIKNNGSSYSPHIHPYIEGYTSMGQLFRADGADPSTYAISPGGTKTFTTKHDLWYGHAGAWTTYGIYLWNDDTNSYYGQLNANGYSQAITFRVFGTNDLRQNGPITLIGSPFNEGGKVYLDIPIKNFGVATSMPLHVYSEGYTSQNKLWRADGAQPTAVVLTAGQSTTIRVQHDLWYGHAGNWSTYGVYIWNDYNNSYFGQLGSNGYSQNISFNTSSANYQSLDIQYVDDANKAISVSYDNVKDNGDGSITADLIIKNKKWIPMLWDVSNQGNVTDRDGTIWKIAFWDSYIPLPPKTTKTIEQVRFPQNSQITFLFSKQGNTIDQKGYIAGIDLLSILSAHINNEIPTGDYYKDLQAMFSTLAEGGWEYAKGEAGAFLPTLANKLLLLDFRGVLEYLAKHLDLFINFIERFSGVLFKSPFLRSKIVSAFKALSFTLSLECVVKFVSDFITTPAAPTIRIVPSTRPLGNSWTNENAQTIIGEETIKIEENDINSVDTTIIACSSQHSLSFDPVLILDGIPSTGWTSALEDTSTESFTLRIGNNAPVLLSSIQINPGPVLNDHIASAIKEFYIETSLNSIDYSNLITGSFAVNELNNLKTFTFPQRLAEYVRIVITQNQSGGSVKYMDLGDILINGSSISQNDIYEPDSKVDIAHMIVTDGVNEAHNINHQDDSDWFNFMGNTAEKIELSISTLTADKPILIRVFQPNGNLIFEQIQYPGINKNYRATLTQTGKYAIQFSLAGQFGDVYKPPIRYDISLTNVTYQMFLPIINR